METNQNLRTKYYSLHFQMAVVMALLGLGVFVGGFFIKPLSIKLIAFIIAIFWIIIGTIIAVKLYTSFCELTADSLICKKFNKVSELKISAISKVDVYGTEYKVYNKENKLFCTVDRGAINGELILQSLTSHNVLINIKQI